MLKQILKVTTPPYKFDLYSGKRFFIRPPKNCPLKFPRYVDTEDDSKPDFISIPVELLPHKVIPNSVAIALESEDGLEIRHYMLTLERENHTSESDNANKNSLTVFSGTTITTDTTYAQKPV